ncbi:hypothetical protein Abu_1171 [Aliarcobacter butzleri RM4018]|uniref:Nuclease SbcCD subunit D n=1 Tax=Aliarcobacter butzleri (strain RM4018) TaxID=367737 RepID=A8EU07_ALIB4|nr:hypothetical protein [Aliarcobacter butzleri]ABV67431.1 hypothetical protein Abu_1171 [Aliarcobacter butzleri RM4018]GGT73367.1 hypothetical protein GCM10007985_06760 [Aliarcobacter butzleri]SNV28634.1 Nuclease sbcCD subunit D [Aliarcobacter butzleri]
MKLLHKSDWHLGQNFMGRSRVDEHEAFLFSLLEILKEKHVEVLNVHVITTGDGDENVIIRINKNDDLISIICAVPFLRDSVIRELKKDKVKLYGYK